MNGVKRRCGIVAFAHRVLRKEEGQGTVEFALVTAGFLVVAVAFGLLWRSLESGMFVDHALSAASHHVQGGAAGVVADVFLF